jgi:hypothetical protein
MRVFYTQVLIMLTGTKRLLCYMELVIPERFILLYRI